MRPRMFPMIAALLCVTIAGARAQAPTPTAQLEAMKKLDWLAGTWKGSGSIEYAPGQKQIFNGTETVESKLGGVVLLVQGEHTSKVPGRQEEVPAHRALGVLYYAASASHYVFQTHLASGDHSTAEATLQEGGLDWGTSNPRGQVRFHIRHTDKDQWHETGEMSRDGQTWTPFFEMTLERQK